MQCLSVVVPCFNEGRTIRQLLSGVLASELVAEVLLVDDASDDATLEIAGMIVDSRIRIIRQPSHLGKGAAVRRGLAEAACDYVVVQDADLEYDPSEYGRLLEPLLIGQADVVYGSRFLADRPRRDLQFWHSAGNRLLTSLSNVFTSLHLTDMETCYKLFRRDVIQSIELHEDRFGIEPEITAKLAAGGWRILEVGISYSRRTYAEGKKIGWRDALDAARCIVAYSMIWQRVTNHARRAEYATVLEMHRRVGTATERQPDACRYAGPLLGALLTHLVTRPGHRVDQPPAPAERRQRG